MLAPAPSRDELREDAERLRALTEAAFDGFAIHENGIVLEANGAFAALFGYEEDEIEGLPVWELVHPDSHARVLEQITAPTSRAYEITCRRKDGSTFPAEVAGRDSHYRGRLARVTAVRDVTDRRRAEEQAEALRRSERLATVGLVAAGLAHEMGNPLTVLRIGIRQSLGALEAFAADPRLPPDLKPQVDDLVEDERVALRNVERAAEIVLRFRTAGRDVEPRREVQLERVVEETLRLAGARLKHRVTVETNFAATRPVIASATEIGQVVLNLVLNGADALDGQPGGRLAVRTFDADAATVAIEVADNGTGVRPDLVPRLFTSFVTTKENGTGLGLAVSRRIARDHGGDLTVETGPTGTTFRLTLPATK